MPHNMPSACPTVLGPPKRNCYYFGKELGVYHFELETSYFNSKRWMLNRLVSGYGVVCGLDVHEEWEDGERGIRVDPGLAIDGYGREIVVDAPRFVLDDLLTPAPPDSAARRTKPGAARQLETGQSRRREYEPPSQDCDDDNRCCHVLLCYHECHTDPAPAHVDDCHHDQRHPGAVVERYRVEVREGPVPEDRLPAGLVMPDCIRDGEINYRALVDFVSGVGAGRSTGRCGRTTSVITPGAAVQGLDGCISLQALARDPSSAGDRGRRRRPGDAVSGRPLQNIVFGPGQYEPGSDRGRRLIAHELTHVVQQSRGAPATSQLMQRAPAATGAAGMEAAHTPVRGLIVDDSAEAIGPIQLRKSDFLAQLRAAVCRAANEVLAAAGRTAPRPRRSPPVPRTRC